MDGFIERHGHSYQVLDYEVACTFSGEYAPLRGIGWCRLTVQAPRCKSVIDADRNDRQLAY